jgi:hypothetical protein
LVPLSCAGFGAGAGPGSRGAVGAELDRCPLSASFDVPVIASGE